MTIIMAKKEHASPAGILQNRLSEIEMIVKIVSSGKTYRNRRLFDANDQGHLP